MRFRPRPRAGLAAGALAVGASLAALGAAPGTPSGAAYADTTTPQCSDITVQDQDPGPLDQLPSKPLQEMGVLDAQKWLADRGINAGQGVAVAVIDSGIVLSPPIPVLARVPIGNVMAPTYYHGTDVASLIAGQPRAEDAGGAVGVAPGAVVYDYQIADDPTSGTDGAVAISSAGVDAALQNVLQNAAKDSIKVVNISLAVPPDATMQGLINQLWKAGVIVVAPTGNRPSSESGGGGTEPSDAALPSSFATFNPGENAATYIYPAGYKHVVAVNASMTGAPSGTQAQTYVIQNSRTDVAAPTYGSAAYSVYGKSCVNVTPATSWATALVSGVLAMDQSYFHESPGRAVSRLLYTASGRPDVPNNLVGAGDVQAYSALTTPLQMTPTGKVLNAPVAQSKPQVVHAPKTAPDVLRSTRRNAVWWGLLGGGSLLLALLVRPVLARRRQHHDAL